MRPVGRRCRCRHRLLLSTHRPSRSVVERFLRPILISPPLLSVWIRSGGDEASLSASRRRHRCLTARQLHPYNTLYNSSRCIYRNSLNPFPTVDIKNAEKELFAFAFLFFISHPIHFSYTILPPSIIWWYSYFILFFSLTRSQTANRISSSAASSCAFVWNVLACVHLCLDGFARIGQCQLKRQARERVPITKRMWAMWINPDLDSEGWPRCRHWRTGSRQPSAAQAERIIVVGRTAGRRQRREQWRRQ